MRRKSIRNLCIFIGYALCFAALREMSAPHWLISTGFRLGALLLLPADLWPVIIAADCSGAILYKANALPGSSFSWFFWAAIAPSFTAPVAAAMLRMIRWNSPSATATQSVSMVLKACALTSALLAGVNTYALSLAGYGHGASHMDGGPVYFFFVYFIGHYLGALMVVPAVVTYQWSKRGRFMAIAGEFRGVKQQAHLEIGLGAAAIGVLTLLNITSSDRIVQIATGLLMLFPAALIALRRGWVAAVVLTSLANLAMRLTLRHWYDSDLMQEQILMMIVITITLGTGAHVSQLFANIRIYDRERDGLLWLARQNLTWGDGVVRRGAIELEQQYRKLEDFNSERASTCALSAEANAGMRWSMGVAPAVKLPPAIQSLNLDALETSGIRFALKYGLLADQLQQTGIQYLARVPRLANDLPKDMEVLLYRISYELVLDLCYRYKPRRVSMQLRILNHTSRTVALRIKVWPGKQDVSQLPGPCLTTENVRWLAKTFQGKVKDMTYLDQPSITVFLRDR